MPRKRTTSSVGPREQWTAGESAYDQLIQDPDRDSAFLREHGLEETILRLLRDCSRKRVLDVGCGTGWLLAKTEAEHGFECDIVKHGRHPGGRRFVKADVSHLPYRTGAFDIVVASLLLIWLPDIVRPLQELTRVTDKGGRVIIGLMHPHFYETGKIEEDGVFVVTRDLSKSFEIPDHRIAGTTGPFTYHYRPLMEYVNTCIRVGLQVTLLNEWFLDMDGYRQRFAAAKAGAKVRTGKVPMFAFIESSKA